MNDILNTILKWLQAIMFPVIGYFLITVLNNDRRLTVEETTRNLTQQNLKEEIVRLEKQIDKLETKLDAKFAYSSYSSSENQPAAGTPVDDEALTIGIPDAPAPARPPE